MGESRVHIGEGGGSARGRPGTGVLWSGRARPLARTAGPGEEEARCVPGVVGPRRGGGLGERGGGAGRARACARASAAAPRVAPIQGRVRRDDRGGRRLRAGWGGRRGLAFAEVGRCAPGRPGGAPTCLPAARRGVQTSVVWEGSGSPSPGLFAGRGGVFPGAARATATGGALAGARPAGPGRDGGGLALVGDAGQAFFEPGGGQPRLRGGGGCPWGGGPGR